MRKGSDGGPAFPHDGEYAFLMTFHPDMLRDWFAGQALLGVLASTQVSNGGCGDIEELASIAYESADAMLVERRRHSDAVQD